MDLEPSKQHPEKLHLREVTYALFFLSVLVTCFIFFSNITTSPFRPTYSVNLPIGLWSQFISSKNHQNSSSSSSTSSSYKANCDYSNGRWVFDPGYPLQTYTEHCPFLDPGFRCHHSGRPDGDYAKWRWQPHGCDLPRYVRTFSFFYLFLIIRKFGFWKGNGVLEREEMDIMRRNKFSFIVIWIAKNEKERNINNSCCLD